MLFLMTLPGEPPDKREFYTELYERYYPLMKYTALKITNKEQSAEDIVQDALMSLLNHYDTLRALSKPQLDYYIKRTTENFGRKYIRRESARRRLFTDKELRESDACSDAAEEQYLIDEEKFELAAAVAKLPKKYRDLLIDKYFLDMPVKQLTELYETSEDNIYQMLSRARRRLLKLLKEGGNGTA